MSVSDKNLEPFLSLVRRGIGHQNTIQNTSIDWSSIESFASQHGLHAVVLDGLDGLEVRPSQEILLNWIGDVLQNYEQRYEQYKRAISELAGCYKQHGFKMMVLKGYACSLDWPKPEHRPCGDIDIWMLGQQKESDDALAAYLKLQDSDFKIDTSHHHHTVFEWQGFTVENHYDFINVHRHKSHKGLEAIFKKLGEDDTHFTKVLDEKVYLPSPNLHALFLMRHALNHFATIGITLRQVLDWAFFVEKHAREIDWEWLEGVVDQFSMREFYNCMNAICVGDLGFDVKMFPNVQFDLALKDKVLLEILSPKYAVEEPQGFFKRIVFRYKRWLGNAWKQEMCYPESRAETFFYGVLTQLVKPRVS